ncbi:N-acetylglucosamine-6-phosphate deacetylase [Herbiconiux daphne]|uniref:N-acetylglucosamine-6-phosphate deacetylase n=1 Tax=Herbiconiux daphne TaxID=2970914 RepID=A0ABT2GW54_9MICO|nr:N-acetylglucosamine-6-phosphate deacetylase [Herbiconiux daphne]MCS5732183.1 N-acetylglucosamine-6-phosphate deacetylase [Herbiconiux daphne]
MTGLVLSDARIVTPSGVVDGWLEISGDRITRIGRADEGTPPAGARSLDGRWLLPGFIDLHVHGGGGGSFADGPRGAATTIDAHRRTGTTSMLASLATAALPQMLDRCRDLVELCERGELLGIHLEGPFLSAAHRGAHPEALLRAPDAAELDRLLAAGSGWVKSVTLAPELPGADALVARLDESGVIAAFGHTSATDEQMTAALAGRSGYITHLFNGMPPIHHRDPGPVIPALLDPACSVEIINDNVHVHPDVVRAVFRLAAGRVVLITDAMAAATLPDGVFGLDGAEIDVRDGRAWSVTEQSLAGSTLTMAEAVRNTMALGVDVVAAVDAAAGIQARLLGLEHEIGAIGVGMRADLVAMDPSWKPGLVVRAGVPVEAPAC